MLPRIRSVQGEVVRMARPAAESGPYLSVHGKKLFPYFPTYFRR